MRCPLCHNDTMGRVEDDPTIFFCHECYAAHTEGYVNGYWEGYEKGLSVVKNVTEKIAKECKENE